LQNAIITKFCDVFHADFLKVCTNQKEERAVASLFTPGGTHAMMGEFQGINDFAVVAFLVKLIPPSFGGPAPSSSISSRGAELTAGWDRERTFRSTEHWHEGREDFSGILRFTALPPEPASLFSR
jgi:hypothetical protein